MIELKNILPYMPYGLQIKILNHECDYVGIEYSVANGYYVIGDRLHVTYNGGSTGKDIDTFKPILRPMSDLDETILTKDGYRNFAKINELYKDSDGDWVEDVQTDYSENPSAQILVTGVNWWLFENHFDVFDLIGKGLAISIHDLEK